MIALVVVTDGRGEYLERTVASLDLTLFDVRVLVDDSGDSEYGEFAESLVCPDVAVHHEKRCGLAAAVQSGWRAAVDAGAEFVFHVEEDWLFLFPPPLDEMKVLLKRRPNLAQIVLKRKFSPPEEAYHGPFTLDGPGYDEKWIGSAFLTFQPPAGDKHVFSLNPSLIPKRVFSEGWPDGNEADMTTRCRERGWELAYWGRKAGRYMVEHIGEQRSPGWAL